MEDCSLFAPDHEIFFWDDVGVFVGSSSMAFGFVAAQADNATLYDSGVLKTIYSVSKPLACLAGAHIIELWSLKRCRPSFCLMLTASQRRSGSYVAEKESTFSWLGVGTLVDIPPFSLLTLFVLGTLHVVTCINLVTAAVAGSVVASLVFVCFHPTRIIKKAQRKVVGGFVGLTVGIRLAGVRPVRSAALSLRSGRSSRMF